MKKILALTIILAVTVGVANATTVVSEFKKVGSAGYDQDAAHVGDIPAGHSVWDLWVTGDDEGDNTPGLGSWIMTDLVVQTDLANGVYQNALGGDGPPNPLLFPTFAELRFDTYLTNRTGGNPSLNLTVANPAGGSAIEPEMSGQNVIQEWSSAPTADDGSWFLGRLTLNDLANGTLWVRSKVKSAGAGPIVETPQSLTITLGQISGGGSGLTPGGANQGDPLLPGGQRSVSIPAPFGPRLDPQPDGWTFDGIDPEGGWFDPLLVPSYYYETGAGDEFASVELPVLAGGDGVFELLFADGTTVPLAEGVRHNFAVGTTQFQVNGIDPLADGADPAGFPTFLSFIDGGELGVSFTMTPVPEPGTMVLVLMGLLGMVPVLRRRK